MRDMDDSSVQETEKPAVKESDIKEDTEDVLADKTSEALDKSASDDTGENVVKKSAEASSETVEDTPEARRKAQRAARKAQREAWNQGDHIFKYFTLRDIVFTVVATVCMIITCAVMPLLANVQLFGVNFLGVSFQIALFQAVILGKVRKPGASFISMCLLGVFHTIFAVQMLLFCIISGLLAELVGILIFRGYRKPIAVGVTAALAPLFMMPQSVGWTFLMSDTAMTDLFLSGVGWWIPFAVSLGILALCIAGSVVGTLVIFKLRRSGVVKDD